MQQRFWFTEDSNINWRLDEHTKEVGRMGIAEARKALAECHGYELSYASAA